MGRLHPDLDETVAVLGAKLREKEQEIQALNARYDQLRRRFRSNVIAMSSLFAAQSRRTVQPDLCRSCITSLIGVCDPRDIGEEPVSMTRYLPALAKALVTGLDARIRLATSVDPDICVDFGRANAIGLIFAEAATNALKHAFPGPASGSIYATLRGTGPRLELTVSDCGIGFDPSLVARQGGDGLRFMSDLARQIEGELCVKTSPSGTMVLLTCLA
ncbi:ATP-binding protein [Methylocystis parvus]|uniref:ATP-binding protein n=1 Tax=Methylocystis parvus TaxID=134 RepID=UPI003C72B518